MALGSVWARLRGNGQPSLARSTALRLFGFATWIPVIAMFNLHVAELTFVDGASMYPLINDDKNKYNYVTGLINSAPYLCAALVGCWLTEPLNRYFGRRGAIFISCFISCATCVWQAFTNTWPHMLVARLFLGKTIFDNAQDQGSRVT